MKGKDKKHFSSEQWVDFVNGKLSATLAQAMQRHLDDNCGRCSKILETWSRVRNAAKREAAWEPPESAVRHIKNAFQMLGKPSKQKRSFEIPRLIFDSLWQPAMVGVRSAACTPRQVLYRAGEVAIEMRLEPELQSERVNVTGQVLNAVKRGEGFGKLVVLVSSNKGIVAETKTNNLGEFYLSFVPTVGLRISFGSVQGRDLSIPLDARGVSIFHRN
jgi:hypothetical protein